MKTAHIGNMNRGSYITYWQEWLKLNQVLEINTGTFFIVVLLSIIKKVTIYVHLNYVLQKQNVPFPYLSCNNISTTRALQFSPCQAHSTHFITR